ncbi:S8 family peptidase [Intrasporangium sp.]|uniref:S8 family peptidase n=1 Tax=Intrasporangium sp. TaxID=1925024 RepID=UPI00293B66C5|nr:S8 family serine peptidase [Intrasporangium sp.]MDV3221647.1 S8 family serine peptidase [Intrasporangium sp.]
MPKNESRPAVPPTSRATPRRRRTAALAGLAAVALGAGALAGPAGAAPDPTTPAPLSPWLAEQWSNLSPVQPTTVLVHGTDVASAGAAARTAGLVVRQSFDRIGVVVATGLPAQISAVRSAPGVTYVEGNQPIEFSLSTSNTATRGSEARAALTGADGSALDGSGVSIAVIDSGVDPTHPFLTNPDGSSAVVRNLKVVCDLFELTPCQAVDAGPVDTDLLAVGGHGTHVSGIVAGRDVTLPDGTTMHGAAPGSSLVSLATGAVLFIVGADSALNWVLENHAAPCGPDVPASTCPPIKVTSNSYGPSGGGDFDPDSATVKLQRELVKDGVVTVWANGNDGGDGSENLSNPPGQDPTGGIISVASYDDRDTGTRDGLVSSYSSRGQEDSFGSYPDISAPGENITSSCRIHLPICSTGLDPVAGGDYNTISGTSMAAPHVSGIVAQLFQARPTATPAQVEAVLKTTAHKFTDGAPYVSDPAGQGTTSFDKGHGLVDVMAATSALTAKAFGKRRR